MAVPVVNGITPSWGNITINVLGTTIKDVTSINYDEEQEVELQYGAGNQPVGYAKGNITYSGNITLKVDVLENLAAIAPNRRIQDIPLFTIVVKYQAGGKLYLHKLKACQFKNNGREASQNDKGLQKQIDLLIGKIEW